MLSKGKLFLVSGGVIVALGIAVVPSYYFYNKYEALKLQVENPTEAAKLETAKLIATVGKIIELPSGEEPTIATVSDKEKLKEQAFFANTENGDRVLIFSNAKKAILYRPSVKKVIEVAPINVGANQPGTEPQVAGVATESAKVKLALFNGSSTVGLTSKAELKLEEMYKETEVVLKANASKNDYAKTLIVDLSGKNEELAKKLAGELSADLGTLPEGEKKPEADILLILGSDYK